MQHVRSANPFALMLDPQSILNSIAQSERLEGLQRRVCRPLDKPTIGPASVAEGDEAGDDVEDVADGNGADPAEPASPLS